MFYIPGGKRKRGESDFEALAREIKEELSVRLLPETLSLVTVVNAPAHGYPTGTTVRMICYSADHLGDLTPDSEIDEVAWLSAADRGRCAPAAQRVLEAIHRRGWIR
jgi:ADP-ribose pyrophosphatase YjhB (NUDIX family)